IEHSISVTGSDGKVIPQPNVIPDIGERDAGVVELPPGKEIELYELKRRLRPASESNTSKSTRPHALYGTGKLSVKDEQVFGMTDTGRPGWKLDPALSKLATGKLEVEVHTPVGAQNRQPQQVQNDLDRVQGQWTLEWMERDGKKLVDEK